MTEGLCQGLKEVARPQQRWWVKAPGRGEVSTGAEASQPSGEKVSSLGRGAARWSFAEGRRVPREVTVVLLLWILVLCALRSFPLAPRPPGSPSRGQNPRPQGDRIHGWPMSVVRRASGPLAVGLSLDFRAE